MKKAVWIICLAAAIAALAISGVEIGKILFSGAQSEEYYDDTVSDCVTVDTAQRPDDSSVVADSTPVADSSDADSTVKPDHSNKTNADVASPKIRVDFERLRQTSDDAIGWIYSPGTAINYPVVQGEDNAYYLNHMANGRKNRSGAIFVDYRNQSDFSDYNTVIYGHRMSNGSMFRSLLNYQKQSYYDKHKEMYLYTEDATYTLTIICGFPTTDASDLYLVPSNAKTMRELLDYGIKNSTFRSDVTVGEGDRIVTLSTCSQSRIGDEHRYVLMAKLVRQ